VSRRVAADIGGTFTDLVIFDEVSGDIGVAKALTTPRAFADGVMDTIAVGEVDLPDVGYFIHGTTIVINAITERKGARTALVTTAGFRDVLEIGRGNRPDLYNMRFEKPRPFVPRRWRFEVRERIDRDGRVLQPLQSEDLEAIVARCRRDDIQAIAICLLHSYANPTHEEACAAYLRGRLPEVAITSSHEITREWREYERSSTSVLNAFVQPIAESYLGHLEDALGRGGLMGNLSVMQSNGGTTSFSAARDRPIYLIESGPVAGVMGAAMVGQLIEEPNVISMDIGGTTAKCSLIEDGRPKVSTEYKLFKTRLFPGYPIQVPVVDIVEIGAGGGSIAWFDAGGAFQVGPASAGADPGPACYGRGGAEPTVTDAKLVTGVINPDYFLGGRLRLDTAAARRAMRKVADRLGSSIEDAATAVIRLVDANMINALKLVSVQRGYDPRDFVLVASGGGGPMHAATLGQELGVREVIVPNYPGYFSALGMLMTEQRVDMVRTQLRRTSELSVEDIVRTFADLRSEIEARFRHEDAAPSTLLFRYGLDARYHGQDHTVSIAFDLNGTTTIPSLEQLFHAAHKKLYTFELSETPIEVVNYRLTGLYASRRPEIRRLQATHAGGSPRKGTRPVNLGEAGVLTVPVYERALLTPGFRCDGPAIVEEPSSTTLVYPGQRLDVDPYGQLRIHMRRDVGGA
jgi:N-methylhydantoinase A